MKMDKKKLVFGAVIATVLLFMIAYGLSLSEDEDEAQKLTSPLVPDLVEEQEQYSSKLDAINDLKEVRETNAPSIYDESLIDSLGYYDEEKTEKDKQRIVDSIYKAGRINYSSQSYRNTENTLSSISTNVKTQVAETVSEPKDMEELGLEHQLFFASEPEKDFNAIVKPKSFKVVVDGSQTVKANFRLRMRLGEDIEINGQLMPKNMPVFGFISFKPNRALISIETIDHQPVSLIAYDLQDGSEGIYVENSFRAEASREVIGDVVQDINIAGVPQVGGIKQVFQRTNRNVKVTIANNYQLILKPKQ